MSASKILIIDDDPGFSWVLERSLREEGYEVLKAPDGIKGLDIISSQGVDLVIVDYKMPGLNGLEVLEKLEAINAKLPVIFMTGHNSMPTASNAIKGGAVAYFGKPLRVADLKKTIANFLSK